MSYCTQTSHEVSSHYIIHDKVPPGIRQERYKLYSTEDKLYSVDQNGQSVNAATGKPDTNSVTTTQESNSAAAASGVTVGITVYVCFVDHFTSTDLSTSHWVS